jgi:hypothetical protein
LNGEGAAQSWLGGSSAASFHRLVINRQAGVMLNSNISVNDTLTMISGDLQLNNYTLNLNGFLKGESNLSSVTGAQGGTIRTTVKLKAPHEVNPGNIGVEITSLSNLGTTVIVRKHVRQTLTNGAQSIHRYFQITPATNSQLNATLRFFYLDKELAGIDEAALQLWKGADLGNYWLFNGRDSVNVKANYIVKTGIDHFTRYTLGAETTTDKLLRVAGSDMPRQEARLTTIQVYPNPLHEQFMLTFWSGHEKEYVISLYDQFGHLLQSKKAMGCKGMNQITWNMVGYAKGVYYLSFNDRSFQNVKLFKILD